MVVLAQRLELLLIFDCSGLGGSQQPPPYTRTHSKLGTPPQETARQCGLLVTTSACYFGSAVSLWTLRLCNTGPLLRLSCFGITSQAAGTMGGLISAPLSGAGSLTCCPPVASNILLGRGRHVSWRLLWQLPCDWLLLDAQTCSDGVTRLAKKASTTATRTLATRMWRQVGGQWYCLCLKPNSRRGW